MQNVKITLIHVWSFTNAPENVYCDTESFDSDNLDAFMKAYHDCSTDSVTTQSIKFLVNGMNADELHWSPHSRLYSEIRDQIRALSAWITRQLEHIMTFEDYPYVIRLNYDNWDINVRDFIILIDRQIAIDNAKAIAKDGYYCGIPVEYAGVFHGGNEIGTYFHTAD